MNIWGKQLRGPRPGRSDFSSKSNHLRKVRPGEMETVRSGAAGPRTRAWTRSSFRLHGVAAVLELVAVHPRSSGVISFPFLPLPVGTTKSSQGCSALAVMDCICPSPRSSLARGSIPAVAGIPLQEMPHHLRRFITRCSFPASAKAEELMQGTWRSLQSRSPHKCDPFCFVGHLVAETQVTVFFGSRRFKGPEAC